MDGRTHLPTGTLLDGSYRIGRVVGAGGFGVTYEAEDVRLGTTVAVKEYFPDEFAVRSGTLEVRPTSERHAQTFTWGRSGFEEEARTLAKFRHPSIVQILRIFEANATAYMVMAFEKGPSFEKWLKNLGRLPSQDELDHLVQPLLDALELMHHENFLHRDIAPDNIIIRSDTTPVLLDFGAARKTVAAKTHVMTGMVKQGYSPQEQYATDGRHQGPWSDFYAVGATLYRAVTGAPPDEATSRSLQDTTPPAIQAAPSSYRASFLRGIDACLRVRPADRPQTVYQVRELLLTKETEPTRLRGTEISPSAPAQDRRHTEAGSPAADRQELTSRRHSIQPKRRFPVSIALTGIGIAAVIAAILGYAYIGERQRAAELEEARKARLAEDLRKVEAASRIAEEKRKTDAVPKATVAPGGGRVIRDTLATGQPCTFCPSLVVIPAGSFLMGSPGSEAERNTDEGPQRTVTIRQPLAVGRFATTFEEWDACVADGGCNGFRPPDKDWGRGRLPVINVSWTDAKAYVAWLTRRTGKNYRLLTEAEREYVTRAGTTTPFWRGVSISPRQANYDPRNQTNPGPMTEYRGRTVPVDSFEPNAWGLFNVNGNVWEWVEDCWHDTYDGAPSDGSAWISACTDANRRVRRGGSWSDYSRTLRSAYRHRSSIDFRDSSIGFRVARVF